MKVIMVILVIVLIGLFYITTIREGNRPGGDFSMYIHHAKNIVEGREFGNTGYIYNPFYPQLGPKTYPPVFPMLLSPVYKWFGLNLAAMKIECILFFLASLYMAFLIFRNEMPFGYQIAAILIISMNPFFWSFKDDVASDMPFLFFVYLSLFFIQKAYDTRQSKGGQLIYAVIVSIFIYLSYGTRNIGFILIPCILIYDIIKNRKLTLFAGVATLLFILFVGLQAIFFQTDTSYFDQFFRNPKYILKNAALYTHAFILLWDGGAQGLNVLRNVLFLMITGLAAIGYGTRLKKMTIFEIFIPIYLAVILIWPTPQGARFLIPVIPLMIFYSLLGVDQWGLSQRFRLSLRLKTVLLITLGIVMTITTICKYKNINFLHITEGVAKPETQALFEHIREHTTDDDIFIYKNPRILALYTKRSASCYHHPREDRELLDYFQGINATYIILSQNDPAFFHHFVERVKDLYMLQYSNADFKVYRINGADQNFGGLKEPVQERLKGRHLGGFNPVHMTSRICCSNDMIKTERGLRAL